MNNQVCCAHSKIQRHVDDMPSGFHSEYWKCDTCATRFYPETVDMNRIKLRAQFAGLAMQGILSANAASRMESVPPNLDAIIALESVRSADALIAELDK